MVGPRPNQVRTFFDERHEMRLRIRVTIGIRPQRKRAEGVASTGGKEQLANSGS
jgi:hypothetical protein